MNRATVLDGAEMNVCVGHGAGADRTVFCEMCKNKVPLSAATIASNFADGRPAFACEVHRIAFNDWAIFWSQFCLKELKDVNQAN